jgi:hypothetical protein
MARVPGSPIRRGREVGGAVRGAAGKASASGAAVVGRLTKTLRKGADVAQQGTNEAADKLTRGIQDSIRMVQEQNMKLAQGFFQDSTGTLRDQIRSNRETLEGLTDQVPGGNEEPFKNLVSQLLEAYDQIEETLDEALGRISDIDPSELLEDAAGEAEETAEDAGETAEDATDEVEGAADDATGTAEGAVGEVAGESEEAGSGDEESQEDEPGQGETGEAEEEESGDEFSGEGGSREGSPQGSSSGVGGSEEGGSEGDGSGGGGSENGVRATKAAKRKAEELGVDLSQVRGTGANGLVTIRDVVGAQG